MVPPGPLSSERMVNSHRASPENLCSKFGSQGGLHRDNWWRRLPPGRPSVQVIPRTLHAEPASTARPGRRTPPYAGPGHHQAGPGPLHAHTGNLAYCDWRTAPHYYYCSNSPYPCRQPIGLKSAKLQHDRLHAMRILYLYSAGISGPDDSSGLSVRRWLINTDVAASYRLFHCRNMSPPRKVS